MDFALNDEQEAGRDVAKPILEGHLSPGRLKEAEAGAQRRGRRAWARRDGAVWRLDGVKVCVPAAHVAGRVLVPATTGEDSVGLFLLDPTADGVQADDQQTTSGQPEQRLELAGAPVPAEDVLGDPDGG